MKPYINKLAALSGVGQKLAFPLSTHCTVTEVMPCERVQHIETEPESTSNTRKKEAEEGLKTEDVKLKDSSHTITVLDTRLISG